MFGVSLSEMGLVALVALLVVGPQKLPGMLRTVGEWTAKLRRLAFEMRAQTGIDEILREEGIDGVAELRSLLRGEIAAARGRGAFRPQDEEPLPPDPAQEYPPEGPDSLGALPDDLIADESSPTPDVVDPARLPSAEPTSSSPAEPGNS